MNWWRNIKWSFEVPSKATSNEAPLLLVLRREVNAYTNRIKAHSHILECIVTAILMTKLECQMSVEASNNTDPRVKLSSSRGTTDDNCLETNEDLFFMTASAYWSTSEVDSHEWYVLIWCFGKMLMLEKCSCSLVNRLLLLYCYAYALWR